MFLSSLRRWTNRTRSAPGRVGRQAQRTRFQCEEFEPRLQPSVFLFSTGLPRLRRSPSRPMPTTIMWRTSKSLRNR
jgi:hypothetical protein